MKRIMILAMLSSLATSAAFATEAETDLIDTSSTQALDTSVAEPASTDLDFETLNVEGKERQRPRVTMADRMKLMRDRMEKRTADLVLRNIEKTRIKMELDMMKKINVAMEQQLNQNLKAME